MKLDTDMAVFTPEHLYPQNYTLENCGIWLPPFDGYNIGSAYFLCNGAFYANPNNNILSHLINTLGNTFLKHIVEIRDGKALSEFSPETCGCWQLSNASKKYPFIILQSSYIFTPIEYVLNMDSINPYFRNEIVSSCISNYDESKLDIIK